MNRPATAAGDALLAFRLAHWLDLLAAKAPAGGAMQPVAQVREVDNDVRLPSHAAVVTPLPRELRQGAGAPAALVATAATALNARPPADELSVAARAINTVLSQPQPQPHAERLRGSAPVWPAAQAPSASGLAVALAQTVSESGLFYESHLAEFAAGARPLAQMQRKPQARLAHATAAVLDASPSVKASLESVESSASSASSASTGSPISAAPAASPASAHPLEQPAQQSLNVAIHPQAAPLVHQQLDLLESGAFRWTGEAWPGVPMEWSIEEEGERGEDRQHPLQEDAPPPAARWSTSVSLTLPRMGRLEFRLSLTGPTVRAHIAAHEAHALVELRNGGADLSQRFAQAGLQVQALQFAEPTRP